MDPYSAERWILERHAAVIATAETRSRLISARRGSGPALWLATHLRSLADRLDGRREHPVTAHLVSDCQS